MFALVLGAGGTVGMSSHAGVLRALQEAGVAANDADLVVGTSAGAIIGSLLRKGVTVDDMWSISQGEPSEVWDDDPAERAAMMFTQAWRTPAGFARRAVGSAWVLQRSMFRWPPLPVPARLAHHYRGGLVSPSRTRLRLTEVLGDEWPERDLRLCTVDLISGQRLVLGGDRATKMPLHAAARASSAVPGLFEPVRAGGRVLVDGGAHSTTNADVAGRAGADVVIIAAPMAVAEGTAMAMRTRLTRHVPSTSLAREVTGLRRRGVDVLVLAPSADELTAHGTRMLRPEGNEEVALAAYDATRRILDHADADVVLRAARASTAAVSAADLDGRSGDHDVVGEPVLDPTTDR